MIASDYHFNWVIDGLPGAYLKKEDNEQLIKYESGIPIGYHDKITGNYYVYNHHQFTIKIHETYDDK